MKTWIEKREVEKQHQVKVNPQTFADMPAGCMMLIPTPKIVDKYVKQINKGSFFYSKDLRKKMALDYKSDNSCPLVTGISLRIISEAAYEEYEFGTKIEDITPFWRAVESFSKLANKLTSGVDFILKYQDKEGIYLI